MTACCESFEEYRVICAHTDERYELVRGKLVKLNPLTVLHYRIAKFLERVLDQAIGEYLDPDNWECFRETEQRTEDNSSRLPDLAIVSRLEADRLLKQTAVFESPCLLVVGIVSPSSATEDYTKKLEEYQKSGIPEYWIVDYEGLGSAKYIGSPKAPTLTICWLVNGRYQIERFRGEDRIDSPTFKSLTLTANQVFSAGAKGDRPL